MGAGSDSDPVIAGGWSAPVGNWAQPALADYWAWRRRKVPLPINKTTQELIDLQDGRCSICGGLLFAVEDRPQNPRQWERWLTTTGATVIGSAQRAPGTTGKAAPRLAHADCRRGTGPALHNAHAPSGLARAGCAERARPVLRGAGRSNAPGLPDTTGRPLARDRLAPRACTGPKTAVRGRNRRVAAPREPRVCGDSARTLHHARPPLCAGVRTSRADCVPRRTQARGVRRAFS
jgi:hypothetical protein